MPSNNELTQQDLERKLHEHIQLIEASLKNYDNGLEAESMRLATSIRVLVHDTNQSKSLLKHLNVKEKIAYFDSVLINEFVAPKVKEALFPNFSHTFTNDTIKVSPVSFDKSKVLINNFENWWNGIITKWNNNVVISRKELVLNIVNKDGGAHIDSDLKLGIQYANVTRGGHLHFTGKDHNGNSIEQVNSPEKPLIYLIAKELISSIKEFLSTSINRYEVINHIHSLKTVPKEITSTDIYEKIRNEIRLHIAPDLVHILDIDILKWEVSDINFLIALNIQNLHDFEKRLIEAFPKFRITLMKFIYLFPNYKISLVFLNHLILLLMFENKHILCEIENKTLEMINILNMDKTSTFTEMKYYFI